MRKLLFRIAGVDASLMERCPGVDRIWGVQLGISLIINLCFIFLLAAYSIGYIVPNLYFRIIIACVIATVVALFDRALFQSDWFQMNLVRQIRDEIEDRKTRAQKAATILYYATRIFFRLGISLVIAYTLSLFVELAVFQAAISQKIDEKLTQDNAPFYQSLRDLAAQLDGQIANLNKTISSMTTSITTRQTNNMDSNDKSVIDNNWNQIRENQKAIGDLRQRISVSNDRIRDLQDDVDAEKNGVKIKTENTGLRGCGPGTVCQTKMGMIANLKQERDQWAAEIEQRNSENATLAHNNDAISEKYARVDDAAIAEMKNEREALLRERDHLQSTRESTLASKEAELRRSGLYLLRRDDPIIRIGYLDELKDDPVRGTGVTKISWLVRIFIMFLEIVPVVAKMFFSPPSAYAMYARAQIVAGQLSAYKDINEKIKEYKTVDITNMKEIDELVRMRKERMSAARIFDEEELKYWIQKAKKGRF